MIYPKIKYSRRHRFLYQWRDTRFGFLAGTDSFRRFVLGFRKALEIQGDKKKRADKSTASEGKQ